MSKTLTIFRHELLTTLKRTSFILVTIAFPLLVLLGFGVYQGVQHWYRPPAPAEVKIGYVDGTGTFNEYTSQLGATFVSYSSEEEAKADLLAQQIKEYLVIPSDYLSTGSVIRFTMEREMELPTMTLERTKGFLLSNLLAGQNSPEIIERAKTPMLMASVRLNERGEVVAGQTILVQLFMPLLFAILFMLSILLTSGYLLQSVAQEKETRLMEILLSSVSARQLLAGKVLGLGAAGLVQIVTWLVLVKVFAEVGQVNIPLLSGLSVPPGMLAIGLIYYILGYLLFAALSAGIGSIGSTSRDAQGWAAIFIVPAEVPLWFSSVILVQPESVLSRVLTLLPITAPITVMMRLPIQAIPIWELALSIAILAVSVVFSIWAAAKVFRACLLMYGKTPAFREIARYIRQA